MSNHTVINNVDGIYICGRNDDGQLGLGDIIGRNSFTKLPSFHDEDEEVLAVYSGNYRSVFLTNKCVYVCGSNYCGHLGVGDNINRNIPTKLLHFCNENAEIISIHCGGYHTIFRTSDRVYVCGLNHYGQLCLGDYKERNVPTPIKLLRFHNEKAEIISIYCGDSHTIFHTTDGVYACGCNKFGQLGLGDNNHRNALAKLDFEHEIISIYCRTFHTIFYTTDGVYACGNNHYGQLGLGDNNDRNNPTKLDFDQEIISINCGGFHTIFHGTDGVYGCGFNQNGELGLGDNIDRNIPTKLLCFHYEKAEIISIHCGCFHTIFHTTDGVYGCGCNEYGQLGLGDNDNRNIPTKLDFDHEGIIITGYTRRFKTTKRADPNL